MFEIANIFPFHRRHSGKSKFQRVDYEKLDRVCPAVRGARRHGCGAQLEGLPSGSFFALHLHQEKALRTIKRR